MAPLESRMNVVAAAIGIIVAAAVLYLLVTRKAWIGQHTPLPLHPATPRPGTVPAMARGLRSPACFR